MLAVCKRLRSSTRSRATVAGRRVHAGEGRMFVDGCFWHGCPAHGTQPRANSEWWTAKLAANHARDEDTDRLLREAG